jgi:hypothetical protein
MPGDQRPTTTAGSRSAGAERERRLAFLRLPMHERLRLGAEFSRFALRNLGVARRRSK